MAFCHKKKEWDMNKVIPTTEKEKLSSDIQVFMMFLQLWGQKIAKEEHGLLIILAWF